MGFYITCPKCRNRQKDKDKPITWNKTKENKIIEFHMCNKCENIFEVEL